MEGEVHADYVCSHGDGKGEHLGDSDPLGVEHAEYWPREHVEGCSCDDEVEGCEGGLALAERFVAENCLVAEDLVESDG